MSYLHRLVEQSGLRPADGSEGAVHDQPFHGLGRATQGHHGLDGEEIDVVVETEPVPPSPAHVPTDPPAPSATPPVAQPATPHLRAPERLGPGPDPVHQTPGRDQVPAPEPAKRSSAESLRPHRVRADDVPAPSPGATREVVDRHETLLRVVEWLAAEPSPAPAVGPRHEGVEPSESVEVRRVREPAPARAIARTEPARPHPEPHAEPAPPRTPDPAREAELPRERTAPPPTEAPTTAPVEVWIDAVNLTLEAPQPTEPASAAVPVPVPPPSPRPAAGPPARTTTTDRLRRRYLRV